MSLKDMPLSMFEVECDGSSCGSGGVGWHVHPVQWFGLDRPLGRVRVTNGQRTYVGKARGLTVAGQILGTPTP